MALRLDVVCTDLRIPSRERQTQTVRVLGEILPLVLAKYGVGAVPTVSANSQQQVGRSSRFQVR